VQSYQVLSLHWDQDLFQSPSTQMKTPGTLLRYTRDKLRQGVRTYRGKIKPELSTQNSLVYVFRARHEARSVINEAELLEKLKQAARTMGRQFILFDGSSKSFEAAAQIFAAPGIIVVGPHGAGLSNTIFSPPRTGIVEFALPEPEFSQFRYLASVLDFEYEAIIQQHSHFESRFLVDCNEIVRATKAIHGKIHPDGTLS